MKGQARRRVRHADKDRPRRRRSVRWLRRSSVPPPSRPDGSVARSRRRLRVAAYQAKGRRVQAAAAADISEGGLPVRIASSASATCRAASSAGISAASFATAASLRSRSIGRVALAVELPGKTATAHRQHLGFAGKRHLIGHAARTQPSIGHASGDQHANAVCIGAVAATCTHYWSEKIGVVGRAR